MLDAFTGDSVTYTLRGLKPEARAATHPRDTLSLGQEVHGDPGRNLDCPNNLRASVPLTGIKVRAPAGHQASRACFGVNTSLAP